MLQIDQSFHQRGAIWYDDALPDPSRVAHSDPDVFGIEVVREPQNEMETKHCKTSWGSTLGRVDKDTRDRSKG